MRKISYNCVYEITRVLGQRADLINQPIRKYDGRTVMVTILVIIKAYQTRDFRENTSEAVDLQRAANLLYITLGG